MFISSIRLLVNFLFVFLTLGLSPISRADFVINGYGTVGVAKSDTDKRYLGWTNDSVDYHSNTQLALNVVKELTPKFAGNAQIISRGIQDFDADLRLLNLNWTPSNSFLMRAGKIRLPILLMTEYQEVGVLYPWSRPPGELYSFPIDTVVGVNGVKTFNLSDSWNFSVGLSAGGGRSIVYGADRETLGESKDLTVLNMSLQSHLWQFRIVGGRNDYTGTTTIVNAGAPPAYTGSLTVIPIVINDSETLGAGLRYQSDQYFMQGEFVTLRGKVPTERKKIFSSHYVTLGKYLGEKYMVHATRSVLNDTQTSIITGTQVTHALGVNYFHTKDVVFKVDYKNIAVANGSGSFSANPGHRVNVGDASINFSF